MTDKNPLFPSLELRAFVPYHWAHAGFHRYLDNLLFKNKQEFFNHDKITKEKEKGMQNSLRKSQIYLF